MNDFDAQTMFRYEASGYPTSPDGVPAEPWRLSMAAGRRFQQPKPGDAIQEVMFLESIDVLLEQVATGKTGLEAASDRDVSVSSANPYQIVQPPASNSIERMALKSQIETAAGRVASRRALIHDYAIRHHYPIKYSGVAQDAFSQVRAVVDARIATVVPDAAQQFTAVHDNLRSDNPEDWSNAVHSCRRILQALADAVFPPTDQPRTSGRKVISLGPDQYINRLVCYAEDHSSSARFQGVVGSHLGFLGERLDAVFQASQKGSHASVSSEEAHRYVVYTYMLVGDLLSLEAPETG